VPTPQNVLSVNLFLATSPARELQLTATTCRANVPAARQPVCAALCRVCQLKRRWLAAARLRGLKAGTHAMFFFRQRPVRTCSVSAVMLTRTIRLLLVHVMLAEL